VPINGGQGSLALGSTLLHLRGAQQPALPHQSQGGDTLLFNGEIFGGIDVGKGRCDSSALLAALCSPQADIAAVLSVAEGPWALVFWQQEAQTLWVARDPIGRRSLLLCEQTPGCPHDGFTIASTAVPLPSLLCTPHGQNSWSHRSAGIGGEAAVGLESEGSGYLAGEEVLDGVEDGHSRDADVVACSAEWKEVEPGIQSIFLGGSQEHSAVDRWQSHSWTSEGVVRRKEYAREAAALQRRDVPPLEIRLAARKVAEALTAAVRTHCTCIDWPPCLLPHQSAEAASVAPAPVLILFSGGVDSTLIAALTHQALPEGVPIDLATICFDGGNSPDRGSALDAVKELSQIAPSREWRLIEVNASLVDIDQQRHHLLGLLKPAATVMDLNIGAALWLAARGEGAMRLIIGSNSPAVPLNPCCGGPVYRSAARVVLVGHGADEQCAGYGRHRTKFRQTAEAGLHNELQLDMQRMWLRNLGRDDRLIADHGRESRHPFLDERFVTAILDLPCRWWPTSDSQLARATSSCCGKF